MTSPRGNSQKASESSGSEFAMFWSHDYQETGEREGRDLMSSVVVGIRKLVGFAGGSMWKKRQSKQLDIELEKMSDRQSQSYPDFKATPSGDVTKSDTGYHRRPSA
ncbi:endoplasmic reticulum-Golgi intermediate compartment organization [Branchiostoma belcheri]|nr:endoplasmic reticulum-Golgi intermediate compartment organization [Branchiostoma belcheri]